MLKQCKICGGQLFKFLDNIFDDRHGYLGKFDIWRCQACGFGQTTPEIHEAEIAEIYTRYYPRKTVDVEQMKKQPPKLMSPFKRWWLGVNNTAHYHIRGNTKVLDIGCGDCASIREINAMGAAGYGIEPDSNIQPVVDAFGLKVHVGLYYETDYPDKYFDYITMSQVLEHVHRPVELLTSLKRILKDDGQLIIGVPNIDSRLRKKHAQRWLNWHVPYHINHFSSKSIKMLVKQGGYRVRKIRTYTPNLWVELQQRMLNYPVKEGVRVPFFNAEAEPAAAKAGDTASYGRTKRLINKYRAKLKYRFRHFLLLKILFLRVVDSLGAGESLLINLDKR